MSDAASTRMQELLLGLALVVYLQGTQMVKLEIRWREMGGRQVRGGYYLSSRMVRALQNLVLMESGEEKGREQRGRGWGWLDPCMCHQSQTHFQQVG